MSVGDSLRAELEAMRPTHPEVADSALASAAMVLATLMDDPKNSATSRSMCAAQFMSAHQRLRELAPTAPKVDAIDEINAKREQRRAAARGADAPNQSRT
jgi:hypothetical protein